MKIAVFVQARLTSKRFPGKIFSSIRGRTALEVLLIKLNKLKYVKKIFILIPKNLTNDNLYDLIKKKKNLIVFRGSENNVLDRYYKAAKKYAVKNIVRVTSDCPLIDTNIIDNLIKKFLNKNYDYGTNIIPYTFPHGMDVEIFKYSALENAWNNAKNSYDKEHVTTFIRRNCKKILKIKSKKNHKRIRVTLDYKEDYLLIKKIFDHFAPNLHIGLKEILSIKKKYPKWFDINKKRIIR